MTKSLILSLFIALSAVISFAQDTCPEYTTVGPQSSPYITSSDPMCVICGPGATGPWSGAACSGTLVSTVVGPPVTSLTLAYTAVNTDDYATMAIDGGGVMSLSTVNCGLAGNVIGPYTCNGSYGDCFVTVTSTLPFTTVTLTNTGCSSGWVISCPGSIPNAGPDNSATLCGGTLDLNTLLSGADVGGVWVETTVPASGQFNTGTGVLDGVGVPAGSYTFEYGVTGCGVTDVAIMTIDVGASGDAGANNATTLCGGTLDLNTLLSGADPGGVWSETTSSGQFNTGTGVFDGSGLPAGTYDFLYIITSCGTDDTAYISVDVGSAGSAGLDNAISLCNISGSSVDLNDLLQGGSGGNWVELTSSGTFNAGTGVLNTSGLAGGVYDFIYAVPAVGPCQPDTASFSVTVGNEPTADFEFIIDGVSSDAGATGGCITLPITLNDQSTVSGGGTIISWNWDYGNLTGSSSQNPPAFNYTSGGVYTIELAVESATGCQDTTTLVIDIMQAPVGALLSNEPSCFGFTDGSVTIGLGAGTGTETFTIQDSLGNVLNTANSNTANLLGSGWYYTTVDAGSGCVWLDSVFLDQPDPMIPSMTLIQPDCFDVPTGIAIVDTVFNYTGNYNDLAYFWNPNPGNQAGLGADSTGSMAGGNYTLTINDDNGCSHVEDFTITYPDELILNEFGSDPAYCRLFGYQSGNGVVYASATGGTPGYTYLWTNLDDLTTSNNTTWGGLNPATYQITATDANGCVLVQTLELDSVNPIADFTVLSAELDANCEGTAPVNVSFTNQSQYFANPNNPQADTTFFWNLDHDNINWYITHNFNEVIDTTYNGENIFEVCLVAINKNGCSDTACKNIIVHEPPALEPPNIFTPGGTGSTNDVFTFFWKAQGAETFECTIFDRWGQEVDFIHSIDDGWNGDNKNGKPCNDGVYYYKYYVVYTNGTAEEGQGTIQLIREK